MFMLDCLIIAFYFDLSNTLILLSIYSQKLLMADSPKLKNGKSKKFLSKNSQEELLVDKAEKIFWQYLNNIAQVFLSKGFYLMGFSTKKQSGAMIMRQGIIYYFDYPIQHSKSCQRKLYTIYFDWSFSSYKKCRMDLITLS